MRIGISMITKNSSHTIKQSLESVLPFADYVCIVDGNSTDGTIEIVEKLLKPLDIPYKIIQAKEGYSKEGLIEDFSAVRNIGLRYLEDRVDHIMVIDSDDIITNPEIVRDAVKNNPLVDGFHLLVGTEGTKFEKLQLWKTKKGFKFVGKIHEYVPYIGTTTVTPIRMEAMSVPKKEDQEPSHLRNLRMTEAAYKETPKDSRILFYYANSLRDCGKFDEAIPIYKQYLPLSNFWDEKMVAYLYLARCYRMIGHRDYSIQVCWEALSHDCRFSELLVELSYNYSDIGSWHISKALSKLAIKEKPSTVMFTEDICYEEMPNRMIHSVDTQLERLKK